MESPQGGNQGAAIQKRKGTVRCLLEDDNEEGIRAQLGVDNQERKVHEGNREKIQLDFGSEGGIILETAQQEVPAGRARDQEER